MQNAILRTEFDVLVGDPADELLVGGLDGVLQRAQGERQVAAAQRVHAEHDLRLARQLDRRLGGR